MEVAGESVGTDLCVGPNTFCCGSRSRADTQVRPYAGWKVFRTTQASGAQRSVCGAGAREWAGIGAGITPKEPSTLDNPSVSLRLTAPFAQGSLALRGTGDADCRVGPAGLLAMTTVFCHSEERSDVGIRPFYSMDGVRAAEVVGPYGRSTGVPAVGRCRHRPLRVVAGSPPRLPGQRLAKRKARKEQLVKFDFCPITSECSTAY